MGSALPRRWARQAGDVRFRRGAPARLADGDRAETAHFGDDREFLVWAYREMLDVGRDRFGSAIRRLARPGALPAVFHCTAGKDRTGLLAALILSALGVTRTHVLEDYQLSADAMQRMLSWVRRTSPDVAERLASVPAFYFAALPSAMDHVLSDLTASHGSIRDYVLSIGVEVQVLDELEVELLEPA